MVLNIDLYIQPSPPPPVYQYIYSIECEQAGWPEVRFPAFGPRGGEGLGWAGGGVPLARRLWRALALVVGPRVRCGNRTGASQEIWDPPHSCLPQGAFEDCGRRAN